MQRGEERKRDRQRRDDACTFVEVDEALALPKRRVRTRVTNIMLTSHYLGGVY